MILFEISLESSWQRAVAFCLLTSSPSLLPCAWSLVLGLLPRDPGPELDPRRALDEAQPEEASCEPEPGSGIRAEVAQVERRVGWVAIRCRIKHGLGGREGAALRGTGESHARSHGSDQRYAGD